MGQRDPTTERAPYQINQWRMSNASHLAKNPFSNSISASTDSVLDYAIETGDGRHGQ